jgi:hypothetical protein
MAWLQVRQIKSRAKCRGGKNCPYFTGDYWNVWIPKGEMVLEFDERFYCLTCAKNVLNSLEDQIVASWEDIDGIKNEAQEKEQEEKGFMSGLLRNPEG